MQKITIKSIKGEKNFSQTFQSGIRFHCNNLSSVVVLSDTIDLKTEGFCIEFAVSVRKKIVKKAVCRNRIKRLLRQSFRLIVAQNQANNNFFYLRKIIFFWNGKLEQHSKLLRLNEVYSEMLITFDKIYKYLEKKKRN